MPPMTTIENTEEVSFQEVQGWAEGLIDDPKDTRAMRSAEILLSAMVVGPRIQALREFTSIPWNWLQAISYNLRRDGVWRNSLLCYEWLESKDPIGFICDTLVGTGRVRRVKGTDGTPEYRAAKLLFEKSWMEP